MLEFDNKKITIPRLPGKEALKKAEAYLEIFKKSLKNPPREIKPVKVKTTPYQDQFTESIPWWY